MERRAVCEDNSKLEKKANEMAGNVFILSSPKQARTAVLNTELKLYLKAGTMVGKYKGQEPSVHM
jgi:DNA polymerase I-like protein with 3'-5' exonuclease and polymerase domains